MKLSRTLAVASLTVASFALAASAWIPPAGAADETPEERNARSPNVVVKITIGKVEAGQRKPLRSYQLIASGAGRPVRLSTANRIPVATVTAGPDEKHPQRSYTYQNVGFQASVRTWVIGATGNIMVNADVEDTALYNPDAVHSLDSDDQKVAPVFTSFTQSIEAVLRSGSPALSTLVDGPTGQSLYMQLDADIQQ